MDIFDLSVGELIKAFAARELSSAEVVKAYLQRINTLDPKLGTYITVFEDEAMKAAEDADKRLLAGGAHPLCGVPIAL